MFKTANAIAVIKQSLQGSFNNSVTFPEHVKSVKSVGVTGYEVDLQTNKVTYYFEDKTIYTEPLPLLKSNFMPSLFAKKDVAAAVKDIQKKAIDYSTFLDKIVTAGTKSYDVNIEEGMVIYKGESDQHIENFPKL